MPALHILLVLLVVLRHLVRLTGHLVVRCPWHLDPLVILTLAGYLLLLGSVGVVATASYLLELVPMVAMSKWQQVLATSVVWRLLCLDPRSPRALA